MFFGLCYNHDNYEYETGESKVPENAKDVMISGDEETFDSEEGRACTDHKVEVMVWNRQRRENI
ncbi:MAG: hypothetical protein K6G27_10065 [Lachnospiraceae bacterium]|nr:hypothetical protein [Lachnospiraceae bacterium]